MQALLRSKKNYVGSKLKEVVLGFEVVLDLKMQKLHRIFLLAKWQDDKVSKERGKF